MKNNKASLSTKILFKYTFNYMKGYSLNYILSLLLTCVSVGISLLVPYFNKLILEVLGKDIIDFNYIVFLVILAFISIILSSLTVYFRSILLSKTGLKIVYKIREDLLIHVQNLSHEQFNNIPVGTLTTRLTSDLSLIYNLYTSIMVSLVENVVTVIGVFIAMSLLNVELTLILLTIVPILLGLSILFRYYSRKAHRKVRDNVSSMNAFLSENISGMKITQVFNQEDKKYDEFKNNNKNLRKSLINEIYCFGLFRPSIFLLNIFTIMLVFYFGGGWVIDFNLGITTVCLTYDCLYAFYLYISKFFTPIQSLADQFNELQSSLSAVEKVVKVFQTESTIKDSTDAIDINITGDIEFKNVWFSYIKDEWVLKDVSFHIHKGESIAFVGDTGSGKSTILNLIVRNYDIQKGQILIDGIDIKKIKLSSLRSQIGQMLQDVFLFSGSIISNIKMNDENIDDSDVIKACNYINASNFIEKLPNQYYEEVRERGNNLSLGQRQLISFARTIVHKPKIMILDEATANIDTETEVLIQDSLEKIMNMATTIVVAHRLSTIQNCDMIYVFKNGKIIEEGNHLQLLDLKGKYYKLFKMQYTKEKLLKTNKN